jgi:hypothetical protein
MNEEIKPSSNTTKRTPHYDDTEYEGNISTYRGEVTAGQNCHDL